MGKLSPEQKKTLAELQALADAPDDEDYEVALKNEHGREVRMPASKAAAWLKKEFGFGADEEAPAGDGEGDGDGDGDDGDDTDPAPKGGGYFTRRKA